MKTCIIVRHAKSSRKDTDLPDHDRPLKKRGESDAAEMARRLERAGYRPQRFVASSAARAIATARIFAETMNMPSQAVRSEPRLYGADVEDWLGAIAEQDDALETVALFGHNPEVERTIRELAPDFDDAVPTCALAVLACDGESWADFAPGRARLVAYEYPKKQD